METNQYYYDTVASSKSLRTRFSRGANGNISLAGEEGGTKWLTKKAKHFNDDGSIPNELAILEHLQETGVVPKLHPSWKGLQEPSRALQGYLNPGISSIRMELLDNAATLQEYAEACLDGELPLEVFGAILKATRDAINAVAGMGITHNDLHYHNIVVCLSTDGEWQAKMIDFGRSYHYSATQDHYQWIMGNCMPEEDVDVLRKTLLYLDSQEGSLYASLVEYHLS